jgi:hypothetical protein
MYVGTIHAYCLRLPPERVPRYATFSLFDDHRLIGLVLREYFALGLGPRHQEHHRLRPASLCTTVDVVENEMIPVDQLPDGPFKRLPEAARHPRPLPRPHAQPLHRPRRRGARRPRQLRPHPRAAAAPHRRRVSGHQPRPGAAHRAPRRRPRRPLRRRRRRPGHLPVARFVRGYIQSFRREVCRHASTLARQPPLQHHHRRRRRDLREPSPRDDKPIRGSARRPARCPALLWRRHRATTRPSRSPRPSSRCTSGVAWRDMAILLRATKTSGAPFLDALEARGDPLPLRGPRRPLPPARRALLRVPLRLARGPQRVLQRPRARSKPSPSTELLARSPASTPRPTRTGAARPRPAPAGAESHPRRPTPTSSGPSTVCRLLRLIAGTSTTPKLPRRLGTLARFTEVLADFEQVTRRARRIHDPEHGWTVRGGLARRREVPEEVCRLPELLRPEQLRGLHGRARLRPATP